MVVVKRLTASIVSLGLAMLAAYACAEPLTLQDYLHLNGPEADVRLAYGREPSQFVEYFRPSGRGPFPVVAIIHGGCWMHKYGGMRQVAAMAKELARRGIATWSIDYRGIDEPGGGFPGTYNDVAEALQLIQRQADREKLDLSRFVVVGHSAGGQLALWAAADNHILAGSTHSPGTPIRISAVIALGALTDLGDASAIQNACGIDPLTLIGPGPRREALKSTSPIDMLPLKTPRIVLINGSLDHVSSPSVVANFASKARAAGNFVQVITVPGATHFDEISPRSAVWAQLLRAIQVMFG